MSSRRQLRLRSRSFCYVREVSLDHDLGEGDVGNGYEVICFIEEMAYLNSWWNVPVVHIHTANPAARIKMQKALENIEKIVAAR